MQAGSFYSTYPFTARLRGVLDGASTDARRTGGTTSVRELLRLLAADEGGVAALVLQEAGSVDPNAHGAFAPATLVEAMEAEARRFGHSYLGTEHLLLALLHLTDASSGDAAPGSAYARARREVQRLLAEPV